MKTFPGCYTRTLNNTFYLNVPDQLLRTTKTNLHINQIKGGRFNLTSLLDKKTEKTWDEMKLMFIITGNAREKSPFKTL